MQVQEILRQATRLGASDVHLISDCVPMVRISGQLIPYPDAAVLSAQQCGALIYDLLNEQQRARFEREYTLDFSFMLEDARFRGNVFFQRRGIEAVLRVIPNKIPKPEDLDLPPQVVQTTELINGLVLVTGPTGSGKSTTLACLIDLINQKRRANIITIEDPIEFIYDNKNSVISQREVGVHTPSFNAALKYVLRQDPNVVLVGELRDYETISAALTIAETGHLVFSTLHTLDAAQSVDRIIDVFPARQQAQIRTQLSGILKVVVSQQLIQKADTRGRIAAREIMVVNQAISNLIRQGKTHEIYSAIELGVNNGMISMDRALGDLLRRGHITEAEMLLRMTAEAPITSGKRSR
jgi:twitching motility protein PilT